MKTGDHSHRRGSAGQVQFAPMTMAERLPLRCESLKSEVWLEGE